MKLQDTVNLMLSDDWKERILAEYYQLIIRIQKLRKFHDSNWKHQGACDQQLKAMLEYREALENRMTILEIEY